MRVALIDADSIAYILGWFNKDHRDEEVVKGQVDDFVTMILNEVDADGYLLILSPGGKTFRHSVYKYKPYKGTRPPKEEYQEFWCRVVNTHLMSRKWNAFDWSGLEADDLVHIANETFSEHTTIICSPDKDLKQISGLHFDYKTGIHTEVSHDQSRYNFWYQVLTGDTTDNVAGCPKVGEVKAKEILKGCQSEIDMVQQTINCYTKYFNNYYGRIIYQETKDTIQLMGKHHGMYGPYNQVPHHLLISPYHKMTLLNEELLTKLGWTG